VTKMDKPYPLEVSIRPSPCRNLALVAMKLDQYVVTYRRGPSCHEAQMAFPEGVNVSEIENVIKGLPCNKTCKCSL
jgi:hypothetical protein